MNLKRKKSIHYLDFADSTYVEKFLDSGHESAAAKCLRCLDTLLK